MASDMFESVAYKQVKASGNVWPKSAGLVGIFVSTIGTTPTITVYDDSGTGTTVTLVDTFTPVAGTYYKLPFYALNGINVVIGGTGTTSATVGFLPETMK